MLTISRKIGQKIVLDNGRITITAVRGGSQTIRIGVDAPREVRIEKAEDFESRQQATIRGTT